MTGYVPGAVIADGDLTLIGLAILAGMFTALGWSFKKAWELSNALSSLQAELKADRELAKVERASVEARLARVEKQQDQWRGGWQGPRT